MGDWTYALIIVICTFIGFVPMLVETAQAPFVTDTGNPSEEVSYR